MVSGFVTLSAHAVSSGGPPVSLLGWITMAAVTEAISVRPLRFAVLPFALSAGVVAVAVGTEGITILLSVAAALYGLYAAVSTVHRDRT